MAALAASTHGAHENLVTMRARLSGVCLDIRILPLVSPRDWDADFRLCLSLMF